MATAAAFVVATLPVSGTLLAVVAAIGAVVGALLWLSQNLGLARDAWDAFVSFAANSTQSVVDAVFGMVNGAIEALEELRQTANKLLPKQLEIKPKLEPVESPDVGGSVRGTGKALGDAGMSVAKDFGGAGKGSGGPGSRGGFRKPNAAGSGGGGPVVHGDYIDGNQDNSTLMDVDNSDGDSARMERLVEDALDRSADDRGTR